MYAATGKSKVFTDKRGREKEKVTTPVSFHPHGKDTDTNCVFGGN